MVPELRAGGVSVSLGADGAPCNNNLDMFTEMRTAALIQKVRRGPLALPAQEVLRMATIDGARALGLESEIGSIEPGKKADLVVLERDPLHSFPSPDPVAAIVYAYRASDVYAVLVDGEILYRNGQFTRVQREIVQEDIRLELPRHLARAEKYGF